jgi:glycogen operon protein
MTLFWLNTAGRRMTDEEWADYNRCFMAFLSGFLIGRNGEIVEDNTFLICANAHFEPVKFYPPKGSKMAAWECVLDTADENGFINSPMILKNDDVIERRSLKLLRLSSAPGKKHELTVKDILEHIGPLPLNKPKAPEVKPT